MSKVLILAVVLVTAFASSEAVANPSQVVADGVGKVAEVAETTVEAGVHGARNVAGAVGDAVENFGHDVADAALAGIGSTIEEANKVQGSQLFPGYYPPVYYPPGYYLPGYYPPGYQAGGYLGLCPCTYSRINVQGQ